MSLLHGITGQRISFAASVLDADADEAISNQDLSQLTTIGQALDFAGSRLSNLLTTSEAVDAIKPEGKSGLQMARFMVASALTDMDMPEDAATTATAGLEAEGADVGLEAFSTIKEYAIKAIEWIQKKWKEFKKFVMKYFNKFFGDVERLKKNWVSILETAKERQTGYTLEKNAKFEFEKGSDAFCESDNAIEGKLLAKAIANYTIIGNILINKVLTTDVVDLSEDDVLTNSGAEVISPEAFATKVKLFEALEALEPVIKDKNLTNAPAKFAGLTGGSSVSLLGRVALYGGVDDNADGALEALKSIKLGFADLTADQKVKTKVTMQLAEAAIIESIADANIELLDVLINIKRGKSLEAIETKLDKASKALDKWKKSAPSSDETAEVRSAFRTAVKLATEYFAYSRRTLITLPLEYCNQAKMVSSMHKVYANKSLAALKKD